MTDERFTHPDTAFLRSVDIHTLLPQQEPFVAVGQLTHFDSQVTVTETTVGRIGLFVEDGRLTPAGLMENIAQTCAARIGYANKYIFHRDIQIGVIGAVSGFSFKRLPEAAERIRTEVAVEEEVFGMILARATVSAGDETIATCQIKISIKAQTA